MSNENHTHDDCVHCLQKEARRLKAELDASAQTAKDLEFELEIAQGDGDKSRIVQYLRDLDAANVGDSPQEDGARHAIRTALKHIADEESSCVHCGYSQTRHSRLGNCPSYTTQTKFTP